MKKYLLLLIIISSTFSLFSQDCSDLFFSEYIEGSGNNKALEIYNPTDGIINLDKYYVARYSNGSTNYTGGGITHLEGFLPAHSTFIFVNGQTVDTDLGGGNISPKCNPDLQELADQLDHEYPAPTYMNGNDAIALLRTETGELGDAIAVDLFGMIGGGMTGDDEGWANFTDAYAYKNTRVINGTDTTYVRDSTYIENYIVPEGYYWIPWTSNRSLYRIASVTSGVIVNPEVFNVTLEWDTVPGGINTWDSLGTHTCDCSTATSTGSLPSEQESISIYPNPVVNNHFTIRSTEPVLAVTVYNVIGQTVHQANNDQGNKRIPVHLNNIDKGVYLVRIKLKDKSQVVKKILVK
jgi:hypothetical protein